MNEPSWLAQGTAWFTNNVLIVTRFADWNNPKTTGILTMLLVVLGVFVWIKGEELPRHWQRVTARFFVLIIGINVGSIALAAIGRWA